VKIVVDRDIPFMEGVFEPWARVHYLPGDRIDPAVVCDADALVVRTRTRCDAALLQGSRVRFVGTATVGTDHIDTVWCASHGITVASAAGSNSRAVLQWVAAALAWLAANKFPSLLPGRGGRVDNRQDSPVTLGVVGVGHTGSLVAQYARRWGFRVMCSDPPRERAEGLGPAGGFFPLAQLAAFCDIVTLHVPYETDGLDATRHLVGREFLGALRQGGVVLNSSRGAVIEPVALRERGGETFVIDTWNDEPALDRGVLARVLLGTPHIAGYSIQGKAAATAMVVRALARRFALPLGGGGADWYPAGVPGSRERSIGWDEMCRVMPRYFDIATQSASLKASPGQFETMRNNYLYREEFF
jgi:erythronate-4-phosphate dehydrogenase